MRKAQKNEGQRVKRRNPITPIIILLVILIAITATILIIGTIKKDSVKEEKISYSRAFDLLEERGKINKILLYPGVNTAKLCTVDGDVVYVARVSDMSIFIQTYNQMDISDVTELEVLYPEEEISVIEIVVKVLPAILYSFVISFIFFSIIRALKRIDISKKLTGNQEILCVDTSKYSFNDVAGIERERMEVEEVVNILKNPDQYRKTGAKIPKGILLSGEPGTGKTLIAKAIAGEAGVKFYECAGSNFENMYVGVGASKMRKLFSEARKNAPSIIFIDEIDAIAKDRYGKNSYSEQTLNQLLTEMDGFNEIENVIIIAATNHIEVLDSAITRPGRFDRIINIPLPDCKGREEILEVHARNKKFKDILEKAEILQELAKKTSGMSGAFLENILNEAAINAVRSSREYIAREDIDEAFIKIVVGISKSDKEVSESQKRLVAVHESGHAIVSRIKRPEVEILQVSIIPRGSAGGYTLFSDKTENTIVSQDVLTNDIIVSLGGRAAEKVYFNSISVGASADLRKANSIAHKMVYSYAMGKDSQLVRINGENDYNQQLEVNMFSSMEEVVSDAYSEALNVMKENCDLLNELTNALIEKSTLSSSELEEIFSRFNV